MGKKTATEKLLGRNGLFAQELAKELEPEPEEKVSKPKSRSTDAFLESLKDK